MMVFLVRDILYQGWQVFFLTGKISVTLLPSKMLREPKARIDPLRSRHLDLFDHIIYPNPRTIRKQQMHMIPVTVHLQGKQVASAEHLHHVSIERSLPCRVQQLPSELHRKNNVKKSLPIGIRHTARLKHRLPFHNHIYANTIHPFVPLFQ